MYRSLGARRPTLHSTRTDGLVCLPAATIVIVHAPSSVSPTRRSVRIAGNQIKADNPAGVALRKLPQ